VVFAKRTPEVTENKATPQKREPERNPAGTRENPAGTRENPAEPGRTREKQPVPPPSETDLQATGDTDPAQPPPKSPQRPANRLRARCVNVTPVAVYVNSFFEERVEQLFELATVVERAFSAAGIEYRVIGGLAAYLYVEEREPDAGRLTRDIDIVARREDLAAIAKAVEPFGLQYRLVAGVDMLIQAGQPARRAVHMIFSGEKVRPEYAEAVPDLGPARILKGVRVVPVEDLIRMKLTSFRLKDQMHLKDLDEAGVITPEVEQELSPVLRERLGLVRAAR